MKKLLTIFSLVLLSSCSNEVPSDRLVQRKGISFEINSQTPFTGSSVSYHENGQLEYKGNFKDGKVNGFSERYHENGQLKEKVNFKNGKEVRKIGFKYHENGQLRLEHYYKTEVDEDGRANRVVNYINKCFHTNGQVCSDDGTFFDIDGEPISWERFQQLYIYLWSTD